MLDMCQGSVAAPMEILDLEVGDQTGGMYHIRFEGQAGYMHITSGVFDDETMCMPRELIKKLPSLPSGPWSSIEISRSPEGDIQLSSSQESLERVEHIWHESLIEYSELKLVRKISYRVWETMYLGRPAIVKIARFPWEIRQVENETTAYCMISDFQRFPSSDLATPRFLGHVHENGRVMGILLEKLCGHHAGPHDIDKCTTVLQQLHLAGLEHGDVNKHNFIIDEETQKAYIIDFEHATNLTPGAAQSEQAAVACALHDDSRRGAGLRDTENDIL